MNPSILTVTVFTAVLLLCPCQAPAGGTPEKSKQAGGLLDEFKAAPDEAGRQAAFDKILAHGGPAVEAVSAEIEHELNAAGRKYVKVIEPKIRDVYLQKLQSLSDEHVVHVLRTRFLWEPYILKGGSHPNFREVYLAPIWKMKEFLLPAITDIEDPEIVAMRKKLVEYAGYQTRCQEVLQVDIDPTVGKMSPTNIEFAHLDQPPTFMDKLRHYERTLILTHSVASEGARNILLMTDRAAWELDVQEAEFVLAANEVRMLAGSIAWRADPLGCAVARDHSNDRKEGRAKGHMSDVPGKRGFTHRNKRMGAAHYGSEGVGGGRDGRDYLKSLSYSGDGHGGPLYRLARNRVGVGRRGGAFTSQYGTDKQYIHPCPATQGEMWMPPGITARDLRHPAIKQAYRLMKNESYGPAWSMLDRVESPMGIDGVAQRFFLAAIDLKVEQTLEDILAAEKSGDVFFAKAQLREGRIRFKGFAAFQKGAEEVAQRLDASELQKEMLVGAIYYRLYNKVKDLPQDRFDASRRELIQQLQGIARTHSDSIYGKAAEHAAQRLADPEAKADALLAYLRERRNASEP